MRTIKQVLIDRDGLTEVEADERIEEAREALHSYIEAGNLFDAEEVCSEYFGLEPDYIDELM
jgi:hypothetical protein